MGDDGAVTVVTAGEGESTIVPRWMVATIVGVLTLLLTADVGAQFVLVGHAASPILDGALLTILGGVIAASRGPKPADPPAPQVDVNPRHRAPEEGP